MRPPPRRLEAVTFDMGGTLLTDPDFEAARAARIEHVRDWLARRGSECSDDAVAAAFASADEASKRSWENGRVHFGATEALAHILERLAVACPADELAGLVELLEEPLPRRRLPPVEGAVEALGRLRAAGVRLGLVSNLGYGPARVMRAFFEDAGLLEFFEPEGMAFSDEVGFLKPDSRIFEAALLGLGAAPDRSAHVGDLRATDVAGGRALGMFTVRFAGVFDDTREDPEADVVVHDYRELPAALGL